MLLAILDGISNGEMLSNHIVFNDILMSNYKKLYSQFEDGYMFATFEDYLWNLLHNEEIRNEFREAIIQHFLK